MLEVEAIVAEKNYVLEVEADHQKILRYWTKYAIFCKSFIVCHFYSARDARIASAVLAIAIPSVCPSVRHTPVLCQNHGS